MSAEQHLRDGDLGAALADLQAEVRKDPSDYKLRVFLFQLLAVLGDWDRALTQLNVARDLDPVTLPMVQTYREAMRCEVLRAGVFAGKRTPMIFGDPEQWVALLMESLRLGGEGKLEESGRLRDEAFDQAPATSGSLALAGDLADQSEESREKGEFPGHAFAWIADGDTRLGPVLEAIFNGRYYWIPFNRIAKIQIDPPEDLRDVVWMPAHFQWANGGDTVGLIPTRYPGSEAASDDAVRLARKTEWIERDGGAYFGSGQRMVTTDGGEFPVMDIREIRLDVVMDFSEAAPSDAEAEPGD